MGYSVPILLILFFVFATVVVIIAMLAIVIGIVVRGWLANRRTVAAAEPALLEAEPRRPLR